ncbi:MAG: pilus assembly protein PilM [Candidatus Omnitrophica bacterium]|nr:pilus assembly protein PilM [Candidatus Omnitrophota bacterium]
MNKLAEKNFPVGLDIGENEIRVMKGDIEVSVPIPKDAVIEGVVVEKEKMAGAIKDLLKSKGITGKNVAAAVSGRGVVLGLMNIPVLVPEEVKNLIRDKVSKYILFAGSSLLIDFYPIEEVNKQGNKEVKVLSVAVKREIINSYVETIRLTGLNLQAIDAGILSLVRSIYSKEAFSGRIVVLAAVAAINSTIFIFKDGKIHYLHNVDAVDELDSEIESIMAYCKSEFGEGAEIKKIISTDLKDASTVKGLVLRESKGTEFTGKINLLPLEEIRGKEFNCQVFRLVKALGVLTVVLLVCFFFLRFQTWVAFRNIAAISDVLNKPNPVLNELLTIEKTAKTYNLEKKNQEKIISKAKDWSNILQEIKRVIPKKAYLSNLSGNEKGRVVFKGEAAGQNAVFDFVRSLKSSKFFGCVRLEESKARKTEGKAHIYFVIKCQLREVER